jgi:hypothetical protein
MLKRKKDGSFYQISSESDARLARERIDALTQEVYALAKKAGIPALLEEQMAIQTVLNGYVLDAKSFEVEGWQGTRVQSHTRTWDVEKLRKRLPGSVYKQIINVTVDKDKLDSLVKKGTIKLELIEDALVETANAAYVKWTAKGKNVQEAGQAEAAKLAEMLS